MKTSSEQARMTPAEKMAQQFYLEGFARAAEVVVDLPWMRDNLDTLLGQLRACSTDSDYGRGVHDGLLSAWGN